jgi:outer membrane protein TolC
LALDINHPQIMMLTRLAEASQQVAAALNTGHLPKFNVSAKASIDYPNGPILEQIQQNTVSVTGVLSLFEFSRIVNQVKEQEFQTKSVEEQRAQAILDLKTQWNQAQDQLDQLKKIEQLDLQAIQETEVLAKLVYQSYRTGRANYLEVQAADLHAIGAKNQDARTQVQILMQLAILNSLATGQQPQLDKQGEK